MFGYSVANVMKAVVALVLLLGQVAVLVVSGYDPSFTDVVVVLVGNLFGAVAVFGSKNATRDDLTKASMAMLGSAVSVVGFFTVVDPNTVEQLTVLIGQLLGVYLVFRVPNAGISPVDGSEVEFPEQAETA